MADQDELPPITRALVELTVTAASVPIDTIGYTVRIGGKAEAFLDEAAAFMRDARPLVVALSKAVDAGAIEDARRLLRLMETTQADIREAREIAHRLEALLAGALDQVNAIPGAKLVRGVGGGVLGMAGLGRADEADA